MNYMMIDGKKIEMSEETVNSFRAALKKTEVDKFLENLDSSTRKLISERTEFKPFIEDKILHVKLPRANGKWFFGLMNGCQRFCEKKSCRYPVSQDLSQNGYLSINLD